MLEVVSPTTTEGRKLLEQLCLENLKVLDLPKDKQTAALQLVYAQVAACCEIIAKQDQALVTAQASLQDSSSMQVKCIPSLFLSLPPMIVFRLVSPNARARALSHYRLAHTSMGLVIVCDSLNTTTVCVLTSGKGGCAGVIVVPIVIAGQLPVICVIPLFIYCNYNAKGHYANSHWTHIQGKIQHGKDLAEKQKQLDDVNERLAAMTTRFSSLEDVHALERRAENSGTPDGGGGSSSKIKTLVARKIAKLQVDMATIARKYSLAMSALKLEEQKSQALGRELCESQSVLKSRIL